MNIQELPISKLKSHPDNPRLFLREDVIKGISVQIKEAGEFDPAHSLLVRPVDDYYQIIRGHHRKEAATACNLATVPCWVREMTDDEAYLQLALGNVQGELSPLEIGIHALGIDFDKRGRGASGGGLKGYAESIGKNGSDISKYRNGATVLTFINGNIPINEKSVLSKATHLAAIHKTPSEVWPVLVEWMLAPKNPNKPDNTPSVNQVKDLVKEANKFDIPDEWQAVFLPLRDVIATFVKTKQPTPIIIKEVINETEKIKKRITDNQHLDPNLFPYTLDDFYEWLTKGIGTTSWSITDLQRYNDEILVALQKATKPPEPDPQIGEWWQLGEHKLYCGDTSQPEFYNHISNAILAFADPPYNADVADWDNNFNWRHDWLIEKAKVVIVTPGIASIFNFAKITSMPYVWSIAGWIDNGMTRGAMGYGNWIYAAIFSNESIFKASQDFIKFSISVGIKGEKRKKPYQFMKWIIEKFTQRDDIIIDPFLGAGTTLFVANDLGRICIGGEINKEDCKKIILKWQDENAQNAERI